MPLYVGISGDGFGTTSLSVLLLCDTTIIESTTTAIISKPISAITASFFTLVEFFEPTNSYIQDKTIEMEKI